MQWEKRTFIEIIQFLFNLPSMHYCIEKKMKIKNNMYSTLGCAFGDKNGFRYPLLAIIIHEIIVCIFVSLLYMVSLYKIIEFLILALSILSFKHDFVQSETFHFKVHYTSLEEKRDSTAVVDFF